MNSPRLGGRGRNSARGTPRAGTPVGGAGSFLTPAPKGTLTLGKGKARLRAGLDATPTGMGLEQSNNMFMSREASYDMGEGELFHSRIGSFQPGGKGAGEKGRIFAKSEEMTASFHEVIPVDIIRAMGLEEGWKETYVGGYETATGYSWMASGRNTWIWKHQRNPLVPPTVHIFASPPTEVDDLSPPYVLLLPLQSNASAEPALLLVSPTGHFRFWSSIFLGLAGADRFVEKQLPLFEPKPPRNKETITIAQVLIPSLALTTANASLRTVIDPEVIIGTSKGRLFRVSVSRKGEAGGWSIVIEPMLLKPSKPTGLLAGLFGFGSSAPSLPRFGGSGPTVGNIPTLDTEENDGIIGLTMGAVETDGVDVWVLTSSNLAIWRVSDSAAPSASNGSISGSDRLICKAEAISAVQDKLLELYGLGDEETETAGDVYSEGPEAGVSMTGGLPMQMERRETRLLALGVELLDVALIKTKTNSIDPREPSPTSGSRDEDEMETEPESALEELTPVLLVAYNAPSDRYGDSGGISWRSRGVPTTKKTPKRKERSYATIACQFVGVEGLSGNQATPINGVPTLRFSKPSPLPYSDGGKPRGTSLTGLGRGVSIGFGVGGAPGAKQGWFAPRLAALQATVFREVDPEDEGADLADTQWKEKTVTVLASLFEGGMVISTNDGPLKDHLFMRATHPFPRSVGFGIVGRSMKAGSTFTPYALAAARLSSSSLVRPSSRTQMLPPSYPQATMNPTMGEIAFMTTMGIVTITLDFEKIASVDERSGGSNQIRSIMEQAVLYGPVPDNPFAFRFSSNVNAGHLMIAAGQLSQETLESSPKLIKRQLGLTTHLADRAARLAWLIQFINDNGALNRLNIPLRTTLATHAEKIAAAQGVWAWYDGTRFKGPATAAGVGSRGVERSQNMLVQAVELYQEEDDGEDTWQHAAVGRRSGRQGAKMLSQTSSVADVEVSFDSDEEHEGDGGMGWNHVRWPAGEGAQDRNVVGSGYIDPVRAFFKVKVDNIGELVPFSVKVVKATIGSFERSQAWPDATVQAGRLALVLLEAALQFRHSHFSTYGLDPERPSTTPWTAEPRVLEACMYLFEECGRVAGEVAAASETQEVLQGLATVICEGYREQLAAIPIRASIDWSAISDRFVSARRKVWGLLVQHGAAEHAFKLAEEYGDFRALTELCYQAATKEERSANGAKTKKPDPDAAMKKIEHYISAFKQEFAFELYRWWIEQDKAHEIFKQSDQHQDYIDAFFATYDYPSLAWLHQIGKRQFTAASTTLLNLAQSETRLGPAKFMLSMGKLCELVELENSEDVREMEAEVQVYDELLELVDVQQKLRKDLLDTVAQVDISISLTDAESPSGEMLARASAITREVTTRLDSNGRTHSALLFKRLVANLIGEKRLGVEDTLDILALKDNTFDAGDYAVGLQLIYDAKSLSDARRETAIRTLWRRMYLRDDWNELSDTRSYSDAQVMDRLRSTALFATLRDLYTGGLSGLLDADSLSKLIRRPSEALEIPTEDELMERYSLTGYYGENGYIGYTKEDILAIHTELEREREQLEEVIGILEGEGLWDEVARIEENERPTEEDEPDVKEDTPVQIIRGNSLGLDVEME